MTDLKIDLQDVSHQFGPQKVLQHLNYSFLPGETYAVLGGNGSGKTTLLKIIQGSLIPSEGTVSYFLNETEIPVEKAAFKLSFFGPYTELIEELTAKEFLSFYMKFRPFQEGFSVQKLLELSYLEASANKEIRNFSSGMKQRLKLALAFGAASEVILLDEPTSNLDKSGTEWYQELVKNYRHSRTLIIGSNHQQQEMGFCRHQLNVSPATKG